MKAFSNPSSDVHQVESCSSCGGDGRIANSFGLTTSCPSCHGSGRRANDEPIFRDVTKTKASHHVVRTANGKAPEKPKWPVTGEGNLLAKEVQASACTEDAKTRLIREIMDYEVSHGHCTQTFVKKIRKQTKGG